MSYVALRQRDQSAVNAVVPSVGVAGAVGFFFLMLWHLYRAERGTFYAVLLIAVAVLAVEMLYFERQTLAREVVAFEERLDQETPDLVE